MSKIRQREFEYDPVLFLRCHSKTDRDYADVKTQVWQAAFEPSSKSKIVATCGGNQICLIDVKAQEVEQRYTADSREIFYSLAWGTLHTQGLKVESDLPETITILAAAGVRKTIYFLYPSKKTLLTRYVLRIAKSHISFLLFHPRDSNVLLCSNSIGEVYILRLSIDVETMLRVKEINKFVCGSEIFNMTFCKRLDTLLAATDAGLIGWFVNDYEEEMMDNEFVKFRLPKNPNDSESVGFDLVDSVEIVKNNLIAVKCALHGYIYICNLNNIKSECQDSHVINLVPIYLLKWSSTDNYFMGISVNYDKGLLSCGDDKGKIWLYDLEEIKKNSSPKNPQTILPVRIIEWPVVEDKSLAKSRKLDLEVYDIVIAKATIHAKGKYIVAITNNNTVCIWKLTSKH